MTVAARKAAAPAELQSAVDACSKARHAFEAAVSNQSSASARIKAARDRVDAADAIHAAIEAENDAIAAVGGHVDHLRLATASAALTAAKSELAAIERAVRGNAAAIEALRQRCSAVHDDLSNLLQTATAPLRAEAAAKYADGIQRIRDAIAITDALDDANTKLKVVIPEMAGCNCRFIYSVPSAPVVEAMKPFDAALREQRVALARLLR